MKKREKKEAEERNGGWEKRLKKEKERGKRS